MACALQETVYTVASPRQPWPDLQQRYSDKLMFSDVPRLLKALSTGWLEMGDFPAQST